MKIANWVEKNPIRVRMKGEELKWSMRTKLCFLFQSVKGHGSNYVGQRLYHRHSPAQAQTICLFVCWLKPEHSKSSESFSRDLFYTNIIDYEI